MQHARNDPGRLKRNINRRRKPQRTRKAKVGDSCEEGLEDRFLD